MHALVVESSRLYHKVLSNMLVAYDFEVYIHESGKSAIDNVEKQSYDVICVSMHLPDMTGIDFTETVRGGQRNADTPILIVTSESNSDMLSRALSAGATDIIPKDALTRLEERLHSLIPLGPFRYNVSGRALYLEDSLTIAKAMDTKLNRLGLDMDHAFSIADALELLERQSYDLIMTDIVLEHNETGIDFIKKIRSSPQSPYQQLPILAVTGVDNVNRKIRALRAGANDYITKPVLDDELYARISNLVASKRLIEQLTQERQRLLDLATKDHLTGLYNRHFLVEVAKRKFSEAYRYQSDLSVLVMDIDHFKRINDTYGHNIGDLVLKCIGEALQDFFRDGDFVARFGGEEFVILLTRCNLEQANYRAEELRELIEDLHPNSIDVTVSIGTSSITHERKEYFDEVFTRADQALYSAKENGRNQIMSLKPV
ncbi:diguanylate cyclase response regulator [Hahella sp. CCB-MM4]|uniref:diguanylate cyclase n=1 Tax=Hahella sp. (strain CCB-MM4) TaxID=1926491 RepID=UPI000B9AEDDB|nr:diguanylate cyclase [Hahella sp. CCB-MM4]OZG75280.1 diguanylate cyclase response regulator [Hahella sp. CCB-MM4]